MPGNLGPIEIIFFLVALAVILGVPIAIVVWIVRWLNRRDAVARGSRNDKAQSLD